jgi:hypothetical protein
LEAEAFLADKAYDTNELLDMLKEADIATVIPPVKSRKEQRAYNHELYQVGTSLKLFLALSNAGGESPRATQSSSLPYIAAIHISFFSFATIFPYTLSRASLTTGLDYLSPVGESLSHA